MKESKLKLRNKKNAEIPELMKVWNRHKKIKNRAEKDELAIYGDITASTSKEVDSFLKAAAGRDVSVRLNSPGGSYLDGVTIANRLGEYSGKVTTVNDGLAASSAAIIFLAGDERIMYAEAQFMIHEVYAGAAGTAEDLKKAVKRLEQSTNDLVDFCTELLDLEREEVAELVKAEDFLTAAECLKIGVCTRVRKVKNETTDEDDEKNETTDEDDEKNETTDEDDEKNETDVRVKEAEKEQKALEDKIILNRLVSRGAIVHKF